MTKILKEKQKKILCDLRVLCVLCGLMVSAHCSLLSAQKSSKVAGNRIQCANLVYAETRTSQYFSNFFLQRLQKETNIQVDPQFQKVRLALPEVCRYPFAIMSGEGSFVLTDKERRQLRYYVTHGGFLLASAGCSDPSWARSFRAEFAKIFPGQKLTKLPLSHPIFKTLYKVESLATTHQRQNGGSVEAYTYNNRIVMVFSPSGLNDTPHTKNCCCGGDELENAEYINANILAYALLH